MCWIKFFYYYENKIRYPPIGRKALYIKRLTPDIENAINSTHLGYISDVDYEALGMWDGCGRIQLVPSRIERGQGQEIQVIAHNVEYQPKKRDTTRWVGTSIIHDIYKLNVMQYIHRSWC